MGAIHSSWPSRRRTAPRAPGTLQRPALVRFAPLSNGREAPWHLHSHHAPPSTRARRQHPACLDECQLEQCGETRICVQFVRVSHERGSIQLFVRGDEKADPAQATNFAPLNPSVGGQKNARIAFRETGDHDKAARVPLVLFPRFPQIFSEWRMAPRQPRGGRPEWHPPAHPVGSSTPTPAHHYVTKTCSPRIQNC